MTINTFPDWVCNHDSELKSILEAIAAAQLRLKAGTIPDYEYQHIFQSQTNAATDRMIADGEMSKDEIDSPLGPTRRILKPIELTPTLAANLIYQNSTSYVMIGTQSFTSRVAVVKLVEGFYEALQRGDILIPFICLRGLIEHIAHYHAIIARLRDFSVPNTFEEANRTLSQIRTLLVKSAFATRIDWNALLAQDVDERLEQERIKYEHEQNRADHEAKSVLTAIDSLSKSIKGTRGVYEILCEFAHPNVGALMAFTRSAEPISDGNVIWIKKRLSPNNPDAFLRSLSAAVRRIFQQAEQCVAHYESLQAEGIVVRGVVLEITQIVVRRLVAGNKGLIGAYAPCPCGSDKKLKFCCGR